jgi:hypothetical protein
VRAEVPLIGARITTNDKTAPATAGIAYGDAVN